MSNKTIVFPELVAALSDLTNTSDTLCESFLKELCCLIEERLKNRETVKVKRIGVLKIKDQEVVFIPDKELAESINAAFECFDPIELDERVTKADLDIPDVSAETETVPSSSDVVEEEEINPDILPERSIEEEALSTDPPVQEEQPEASDIADEQVLDEQMPEFHETPRRSRFWSGYAFGFLSAVALCVIGLAVSYGGVWLLSEEKKIESGAIAEDSIGRTLNVKDPQPVFEATDSAKQNVDVGEEKELSVWPQFYEIKTSGYLSNVSRKFYGHYAFWIYIYLENEDKIEDPDCLPVGIVLEIPNPEKYGIDKNDPKSIQRAERKAVEVLDL